MLIIRTNGSRNLIGRSALVRQKFDTLHYFASYLIRFRLVQEPQVASWLASIWDSDHIRRQMEANAATSAGQYNVSLSSLSNFTIPMPPQFEQQRITEEVDRCFSILRTTETTIDAALARADRLRQGVLGKAFRGEL